MRLDFATGHLLLWMGLYPCLILPFEVPWLKVAALVSLLTVFLVTTFRPPASPSASTFPRLITPFLLTYLLLALISFWLSPLPEMSLPRLLNLVGGVWGFYALCAWLTTPQRLTLFLGGMSLFGLVLALVGFVTVHWPERYVFDLRPLTNYLPHLSGDFSLNHNAMSGMLLVLGPMAWGMARQMNERRYRWLFGLAGGMMAFLLVLTQSRNAWMTLVVIAAAYWLWGRVRFAWVGLAFALLLFLPFSLNLWPDTILNLAQNRLDILDAATKTGLPTTQSWLSRLEIWSVALQTIHDYPVWGTGLSTFVPISRANYVFSITPPTFDFSHAHNLFLQTGVNLGLAGVLVVAGLWLAVLAGLWRPKPATALAPPNWMAIIGATCAGYLWFNLFDMLALEQRQGIVIWALLAVATRLSHAPELVSIPSPPVKDDKMVSDPSPWPFSLAGLRTIQVAPVLLLGLLCLTPALGRNWYFLQLDEAHFTARPLAELPVPVAEDKRRCGLFYFLRGNHGEALEYWQESPEAVLYLQGLGMQAFYADEVKQAIVWYDLALNLDVTNGFTYFWRALAQEGLGESAAAYADYAMALSRLTGDDWGIKFLQAESWEGVGRIVAQQGRFEDAAAAFAEAQALFPHNPDYAQQLEEIHQALWEKTNESR
ncbi:MAG: O-antigen ligase family protein [Candidatus Promineifilaceae bacterium]